jgi:hypothetical protein
VSFRFFFQAADGIVAVINEKFCGSVYCNNEMAMAQGNGLQMFPLLFRDLQFAKMPAGLQYMLASINCIPFPDEASDSANLEKLGGQMKAMFDDNETKSKAIMRHGTATEQDEGTGDAVVKGAAEGDAPSAASTTVIEGLALVPVTVPELPDVMCERPEMLNELRGHLLGFMSSGAVSVSSVKAKKSKVATHGQGGVGKTTAAAALVHDPMIRRSFKRIAWVSVGQTPSILELQRTLFEQLTGEPMPTKDSPTPESQLAELKTKCEGKHWLVVLDDVWDKAHEMLLNCVDSDSPSKVLVTTRIRGLLKGCDEVSLNLLSPKESVDLLLRTGQVEEPDDEAANAAAGRIAALVGHLPLYISIVGGIVRDYDGSSDWQEEVEEMLNEDRLGVLEEGAGGDDDDLVAKLVDSSLKMLKDKAGLVAKDLFMAIGVCPEDVLIPPGVAQLIKSASSASSSSSNKGRDTIALRRALKCLLDRNLLLGNANGFQMHDIVREYVRSRLESDRDGDGGGIRGRQCRTVGVFAAACPTDGWKADDAVGQYAAQALELHMSEALANDPLQDTEAQGWLDSSDEILEHPVVRAAAEAFGHTALIALGEEAEKNSLFWVAGKRFGSAATTSSLSKAGIDEAAASGTGTTPTECSLLMRACDMLVQEEQTVKTRTLEVMLQGRITMRLPWNHADTAKAMERVTALLAEEDSIDIKKPAMLLAVGFAETMSTMVQLGAAPAGEDNIHKPENMEAAAPRQLSKHLMSAYNLVDRADPQWMIFALFRLYCAVCNAVNCGHRQHKLGRELQAEFAPHSLISECLREYDFKVHHPMMLASPMGLNIQLFNAEMTFALNVYGDIACCRDWMLKVCEIFEGIEDPRTDPSVFAGAVWGGMNASSCIVRAVCPDLSLRLLKAVRMTFSEVDESAEAYHAVTKFFGWAGKTHTWAEKPYNVSQFKRRHWLLAPDEIGKETMEGWLKGMPAEWGSAAQGELIDSTAGATGFMLGGDCAEVFESLERYEEAIVAAETDVRNWTVHGCLLTQSHTAIGRCQAKLGKFDEAEAAFQAAIAEANRCELPFLEMLAHRDYLVSVFDRAGAEQGGKRASQFAALGGAISRMVMPASEYTPVLGAGLDAEAAVAAFKAQAP